MFVVQKKMSSMQKQLTSLNDLLQKQKAAEEAERLRKIQEEMEREKKRKEEEERKKIEEEEERKRRHELEIRRQKEEEERKAREEKEKQEAAALARRLEEEAAREAERQKLLEQERLDRELALRLAQEDQEKVESISTPTTHSSPVAEKSNIPDLTKWKYAELRDTINTSCDVKLLEACRAEFHRRLKVYHAWKLRNKKNTPAKQVQKQPLTRAQAISEQRAPDAVVQEAAAGRVRSKSIVFGEQRYFKMPFMRPADQHRSAGQRKRGYWFAHFDGNWIARQMEIHPDKAPLLLIAGVDDMQMCELALSETGLTSKRGAEILDKDFEEQWRLNGGNEYLRKIGQKASSAYLRSKLT